MTPRAANRRSPRDAGTTTRHLDSALAFLADARSVAGGSSRGVADSVPLVA